MALTAEQYDLLAVGDYVVYRGNVYTVNRIWLMTQHVTMVHSDRHPALPDEQLVTVRWDDPDLEIWTPRSAATPAEAEA